MNVYVVYLNEPDEDVWANISKAWPNRHFPNGTYGVRSA